MDGNCHEAVPISFFLMPPDEISEKSLCIPHNLH